MWADIPGFAGWRASIDGEIINPRGKIIRQSRASNGCMKVHLGKATAMVHHLVLRAFTGHPTHRDSDNEHYYPKHVGAKDDNGLDNLVWAMK